jgi:hypothetical protein
MMYVEKRMLTIHKNMNLRDALTAADVLKIPIRRSRGSELCFTFPGRLLRINAHRNGVAQALVSKLRQVAIQKGVEF